MKRAITPERWQLLEPLVDAALNVSPERRSSVIADLAGSDYALRDEVMALFEKWSDTGLLPLLDKPAPVLFAALLAESDALFETLGPALAGRYTLERKLGQGGMATVYLAHDLKHDRRVALKVLHAELAAAVGGARFLTEIRTTANLQHPHILPLFDSGEAEGFLYYVMPFVEGESLAERLARANRLPVDDVLRIALDVTEALQHAHEHGVVHRDVKPGNILLSGGQALVADFGIALALRAVADERRTQSGLSPGTLPYMSPEQKRADRDLDGRSDLFSLGSVLYEMLTGTLPFERTPVGGAATPPPIRRTRRDVPQELERIVLRCLRIDREERFASARELIAAIHEHQRLATARSTRIGVFLRRPVVAVPLVVALLILASGGRWLWARESRERWARNEALPEAQALIDRGEHYPALRLLRQVEAILPDDPQLHGLLLESTQIVTVESTPPGAEVAIRGFHDPPDAWELLGRTPLQEARLPSANLVWRVTLEGHTPVEAFTLLRRAAVTFELRPTEDAPAGMVFVPRGSYDLFDLSSGQLDEFWIDKHEVTNAEFQEFVDAGAYHRPEWWASGISEAASVTWEDVQRTFRDRTGRPGPATWELGTYPAETSLHPVGGISWLEAAAYCRWRDKELPTVYHWYQAADPVATLHVGRFSTFASAGPRPVGQNAQSIGTFGTMDMAGNVKEWAWNAAPNGLRYILGGGWNEPDHQFREQDAQAPNQRGLTYGVRCALYPTYQPDWTFDAVEDRSPVNQGHPPARDEVFAAYRQLYDYERGPLDARVDSADHSAAHWRIEWVNISAAYGGKRLPIVLFLPNNATPPFQTVVYFPGAGAFAGPSTFGDGRGQREWFLFLVRTGRAVAMPIYQGMFERYYRPQRFYDVGLSIQRYQDLGRTIDYLESRPDIDSTRLAYYGLSSGVNIAPIMTALEDRFKASVLVAGAISTARKDAGADPVDFLPRVRLPTLMINGKDDFYFPYETSQRPMFEGLGTPAAHKKHVVLEGGHAPAPWDEVMKAALEWLDTYLGPVELRPSG
jgi:tRNA A-37 threonylcarbamoyl transferase component Bud32